MAQWESARLEISRSLVWASAESLWCILEQDALSSMLWLPSKKMLNTWLKIIWLGCKASNQTNHFYNYNHLSFCFWKRIYNLASFMQQYIKSWFFFQYKNKYRIEIRLISRSKIPLFVIFCSSVSCLIPIFDYVHRMLFRMCHWLFLLQV